MRLKSLLAAAVAILAAGFAAPRTAEAGSCVRHSDRGCSPVRVVRHWTYQPRYVHVYANVDPYAYRYEPRGYYPYYNSGYWVPRRCYRRPVYTYNIPPYYPAWGAYRKNYRHYKWHARHHGRIRHHHW